MELFWVFLHNSVAQAFGFLAMFVWFLWYLTTNDRKTIKIFMGSNIVWCIHFLFMGNFWALWATAIWLLRLLLSLKYRRNVKILIWVILITVIFWIFTYDWNPISILPLLATAVSSYGYFFLEKVWLRLMLWFVSLCWLIYHTGTGSIAWLVNEIIMLITLWVTIYRFNHNVEKWSFFFKRLKRIAQKRPRRVDFGRFIYFRDKDRFK